MVSRINGKIALAGGAGNVGEGIVRAFLQEGATVVASSCSSKSLEELRSHLGELATDRYVTMTADFGEIESVEKLRDDILNQFGQLDAVVASLGGTWKENMPLTQVSITDWQKYLLSNLTTHFIAARTFLPSLQYQQGSTYTFIGGAAAEIPIPNYSLVAIPAAAQLMLAQMAIAEMKETYTRINEVVIHSWVSTRSTKGIEQPEWITADDVGKYVAWLACDEAYMVAGSIIRLYQRYADPTHSRSHANITS